MKLEDWPRDARGYLPPWFDLEPYEAAKNWTPARWISEIRNRKYWQELLDDASYFQMLLDGVLESPYIDPFLQWVTQDTKVGDVVKQYLKHYFDELDCWDADDPEKTPPVRNLSCVDAAWLYSDLSKSQRIKEHIWRFCLYRYEGADLDTYKVLGEYADRPLDELIGQTSYLQNVLVDLRAPNVLLEDAFRSWLIQERKRLDIACPKPILYDDRPSRDKGGQVNSKKPLLRAMDFNKWVRLRILPYLDIRIWLIADRDKGEDEPTPSMWETILFPSGDQGGKYSEVKRIAEWVMTKEAESLLRACDFRSAGK